MNIDDHWLDDAQMTEFSRRTPSTAFGRELMPKWAARYPELLSSDTYRGCAVVLATLFKLLRGREPTIGTIEQTINILDQALWASKNFKPGTALTGGASLTVANAFQSAHSGVRPDQIVEAYESEAIYVAKKFIEARRRELAGERLT
jgi:hypothetical protein